MLFSTKIARRYSESTIFKVSRGPKMNQHGSQNGFQRQPGSKSVLEGSGLDLGSILASILASKMALETA